MLEIKSYYSCSMQPRTTACKAKKVTGITDEQCFEEKFKSMLAALQGCTLAQKCYELCQS